MWEEGRVSPVQGLLREGCWVELRRFPEEWGWLQIHADVLRVMFSKCILRREVLWCVFEVSVWLMWDNKLFVDVTTRPVSKLTGHHRLVIVRLLLITRAHYIAFEQHCVPYLLRQWLRILLISSDLPNECRWLPHRVIGQPLEIHGIVLTQVCLSVVAVWLHVVGASLTGMGAC